MENKEKNKIDWRWLFNFTFWTMLIIGTAKSESIDLQIKVVLWAMGFLGFQLNNQLN